MSSSTLFSPSFCSAGSPTRLSLLVVLHVVPYLHRLLLVDTVVYIHLARQFDTWFLL